jgi:hypothetical protein
LTTEENLVSVDTSHSGKTLGIRSGRNTADGAGGDFCGDDTAKNLMKGFGNYQNNMMNINSSLSVRSSKKKKGRRSRKTL